MWSKVQRILVVVFAGVLFSEFLPQATSLTCIQCMGARKEPFEATTCNATQNCTGAKNTCMTRVYRNKDTDKPMQFTLECKAKVDCERLGTGCDKGGSQTVCTACCQSDLCNMPKDEDPTSGQMQIRPFSTISISLSLGLVLIAH